MKALFTFGSVCLVAFAAVPATAAVIIDDFTVSETVADSKLGNMDVKQVLSRDQVWSGIRRFGYDSAKEFGKVTIADGKFRFESGGAEAMFLQYGTPMVDSPLLDATDSATSFMSVEVLATSRVESRLHVYVQDRFGANGYLQIVPETVPTVVLAPISSFSVTNQRAIDLTSISLVGISYTAREFTLGQIAFVPEPSSGVLAMVGVLLAISLKRRRE
ncbi:PEP-CTERM sorting domain-containing protein [Planctomycetota bacterium]